MHAIVCICVCEFRDEILLRVEECKTRVNLNFSKKNGANMVNLPLRYKWKTWNFSISRIMKRTSLWTSSREI